MPRTHSTVVQTGKRHHNGWLQGLPSVLYILCSALWLSSLLIASLPLRQGAIQYSPFCKVASTKTGYSLIWTLIVCSLICTLKGCLLICTLPGCSLYYINRKFTHLYIERMLYIDKLFHQLCIDIGSLSTHMLLTECLGTLDSPVHTYTVQYVQCTVQHIEYV